MTSNAENKLSGDASPDADANADKKLNLLQLAGRIGIAAVFWLIASLLVISPSERFYLEPIPLPGLTA